MNPLPPHPDLSDDAFAVLVDVARDPDSVLLALTPRQLSRELLRPSDPVRPTAAFLRDAERHLLRTHRDEVGGWLVTTLLTGLVAHPGFGARFHRRLRGQREFELPAVPRDRLPSEIDDARGGKVPLRSLIEPKRDPIAELDRLRAVAALALRLVRHPSAWLAVAQIEFAAGSLHAAARRFEDVATWGGLFGRLGEEWAGATAAARGRWASAVEYYERASHSSWATPAAAFSWALNSAQLGDIESAARALTRLHELDGGGPRDLSYFSRGVRAAEWSATPECRAALRSARLEGSILDEVLRSV